MLNWTSRKVEERKSTGDLEGQRRIKRRRKERKKEGRARAGENGKNGRRKESMKGHMCVFVLCVGGLRVLPAFSAGCVADNTMGG